MNSVTSRMNVYRLMALYFSSPTAEVSETLVSGAFIEALAGLEDGVNSGSLYSQCREAIAELHRPAIDLPAFYTTLFEVPNAPVPLCESGHVAEGIGALYEDLYRVYEYFGLNFENGTISSRPDVLAVELDFMQYLVYLELLQSQHPEPLRKAQSDFIDRHLLAFVKSLKKGLISKDASPYSELAVILETFIEVERERLQSCH